MAEISTQLVIDAITLAIRGAYPEAIIVDEPTEQGIEPGAFIVQLIDGGQQKRLGPRYLRTPMFDVIYFSDNSTPECVKVADMLCEVLATVQTPNGDFIHGRDLDWHIEDYVLHFRVTYAHFVRRDAPQDSMETLEVTIQEA